MAAPPIRSPFDNDVSWLYKWGQYLQYPTKFLLPTPTGYETVTTRLQADLKAGQSLQDIYARLSELSPFLTPEDMSMLYVGLGLGEGLSLETLLPTLSGFQTYTDTTDLTVKYQRWYDLFQQTLGREMQALEGMLQVQETLTLLKPLPAGPITFTQAIVRANPKLNGETPSIDQGVDIFNAAKVSAAVPYIQFNGTAQKTYKIYQGQQPDKPINYTTILLPEAQTTKSDALYFNVSTLTDFTSEPTKDSFLKAVYLLEPNTLTITGPITQTHDEQFMVQRVQEALPSLTLGPTQEVRVAGEFDIYGVSLVEPILLHMLLNQPLMSTYLYIDESLKDYAEKKRLNIHYKSLSDPTIETDSEVESEGTSSLTLTQRMTEAGRTYTLLDGQEQNFPPSTPYVHIHMTRATSRPIAEQMSLILQHLLQFYMQSPERTEANQLYQSYFPDMFAAPTQPAPEVRRAKGRPGARAIKATGSKIDQLKERVPDLFINGYARRCQCALQPVIIEPEDIPYWEGQTFMDKGQKHRQVMAFPPGEGPGLLFVCPNDANAYPGVKRNDMENSDKYPYYPCCFKKDQMAPTASSLYNEYYRGILKKSRVVKTGHKIRTDKVLELGRIGFIPKLLQDFISRYSPQAADIVRFGSVRSPNSLLHCALIATSNTDYAQLTDDIAREEFAERIRQYIVTVVQPALLRQELYDLTDMEIKSRLTDRTLFLDPYRYYRAVEIAFAINIYTLTADKSLEGVEGSLEIPRARLFHTRPIHIDKPTMLIFKHMGSESDALSYPQCELIVDYDAENENITKIFDTDMTRLLHTALMTIQRTVTWQGDVARVNLYSREDIMTLMGRVATAQYIDDFGKLRGLYLPIPNSPHYYWLITPPAQPENLPAQNVEAPSGPTATEIQVLLGDPTAVTKIDELVNGLWYPYLDLPTGLYVPVVPTREEKLLAKPVGPPNPVMTKGLDSVSRFAKLQKTIDILLQLVEYVYIIAQRENPGITPEIFAQTYFQVPPGPLPEDSAQVYDIKNVSRTLPQVTTVTEALRQLQTVIPSFIGPQGFRMYTHSFSEKVKAKLADFSQKNRGLDLPVPKYINRYYQYAADFTQQPQTIILTSEHDLRIWLQSIHRPSYTSMTIRTQIEPSYIQFQEPYLYQPPGGSMYLIQNVVNNEKARALQVAANWEQYKINYGYTTQPLSQPIAATVLGLSASGQLAIVDGVGNEPIKILTYGGERYAAMLPLF